jgi:hypothetical protein
LATTSYWENPPGSPEVRVRHPQGSVALTFLEVLNFQEGVIGQAWLLLYPSSKFRNFEEGVTRAKVSSSYPEASGRGA